MTLNVLAQSASFRHMHYNLMFYKAPSAPCSSNLSFQQKDQALKTIFNAVQPDILTVNELGAFSDNSAATSILNNAINTQAGRTFTSAAYSNNSFSSITNQLFYDSTLFGLHSQTALQSASNNQSLVRVIDFYRLYHKNALLKSGDTTFITIVVAHLKAGSSSRDQIERQRAVEAVMNYWKANVTDKNLIFAGDFNVRSANEGSYQELTATSSTGLQFNDPLGFSASWNNNSTYAPLHTQSTHSFSSGCKVGGGLDDRFDFILASDAILSGSDRISYKINSYSTIGNDGNHFNKAINSGTNSSVSASVLKALFDFSDHLPVVAEFDVDLTGVGLNEQPLRDQFLYTNPIEKQLSLRFRDLNHHNLQFSWIDLTGKVLSTQSIPAKRERWDFDVSSYANGVYLMQISHPRTGEVVTYKIVKR